MNLIECSRSPRSLLAILLSLSLLAPAALPAEGTRQPGAEPNQTAAPGSTPTQSVPQVLDASEVADLEQRAEEPGPEVAGGALSNQHLTYIVIALAAAVIVLIAK